MCKKRELALLGYGCVGQGFKKILDKNDQFERLNTICIHDPKKKRDLPQTFFVADHEQVLADENIDVFIEATSSDSTAWETIEEALSSDRSVVSASKKAIAMNLGQLVESDVVSTGTCLYEAAVCAAMPVIRTLDTQFNAERLSTLFGVLNGTCNFILDEMEQKGSTYSDALDLAQEKGFAEADPSSDVDGWDAVYKLCILALHAYGSIVLPTMVLRSGISTISAVDWSFARAQGWRIKQVATTWLSEGKLQAYVLPQFVAPTENLFYLSAENNGIELKGEHSGTHTWFGKGAGGLPTGQAMHADLTALEVGYRYGYGKYLKDNAPCFEEHDKIDIYLRFVPVCSIELDHFTELYDLGEFQYEHYAIGKISLNDLRATGWLETKGVVVIVMPERHGQMLLN